MKGEEKMKMKKVLCALLAGVMILSLMGCGSKSGSGTSNNGTSKETTSLTWEEVKKTLPEDASGKTLEIFSWNEVTPNVRAVLDAFTEETGIKVEWVTESYDTYLSKLAARVASGNAPDVARVREEVVTWFQYMQPVAATGYNFNDTYWDKAVMEAYTVGENCYAVNMVDSPFYQPVVVSYNTELIKKYNLEDPYTLWKNGEWTYDKMHEIAKKFVDAAEDGYSGISTLFGEYTYSVGAPMVEIVDGQYVSNITNEEFIKAAQYMNEAYAEGIYDRDIGNQSGFNNGKVLFYLDAEIGLRTGHYYMRELKNAGIVKAVPVPEVEGQDTYYQLMSENEAYGIPQKAENAELAPYLLRYMLDRNNYNMAEFYYDNAEGEGSILEVVDWTRDKERVSVLSTLCNETANFNHGYMIQTILTCGKNQIQSEIDSKFAQGLQASIDAANKILSRMD